MKTRKKVPAKTSLEQQIEDIMRNFDFEVVHEYMNYKSRRSYDDEGNCIDTHQWEVLINGTFKIPSVDELKQLARKQLEEVAERFRKGNNSYIYVHSGPFKSTCRYGILVLECIIEYWSGD